MKMERYLSDKIRVISFILICLVVILHAQVLASSKTATSIFVQHYISGQIARVAVPFFFIISGFLFAFNLDKTNIRQWFKSKIKKRFRTLLAPYMLWSISCLVAAMIIQLVFPSFNITERIIDFSGYQIFVEIIEKPTLTYQLWFIRDLFIVSLLSPLIYILVKNLRAAFIVVLLVCWCYWYKIWFVSVDSFTFFSLGMYIAIYHKPWLTYRFKNALWWIIPAIWLLYCFIWAYIKYDRSVLYLTGVFIGIISIWISYDLLNDSIKNLLIGSEIVTFSFTIYLAHEPTLTVLKKCYIKTIGVDTTFSSLLCYFLMPVVTVFLCFVIGKLTRDKMPKLYNILTGGR